MSALRWATRRSGRPNLTAIAAAAAIAAVALETPRALAGGGAGLAEPEAIRTVPAPAPAGSARHAPSAAAPASEEFSSGPFGNVFSVGYEGNPAYIEIPHHPALQPTGGFTFEAWVGVGIDADTSGCPTIAGTGYDTAWWVGVCSNKVRSYLRGDGSAFTVGDLTIAVWHHIAVTWDGARVRHYVDGQLAGERSQAAAPTTNTEPMRIGRDVDWSAFANLGVDEVRLWSRALSQSEIHQKSRFAIRSPEPGLVAVWSFDDTSSGAAFARDDIGAHDGAIVSGPAVTYPVGRDPVVAPPPPYAAWLATAGLPGFDFQVRITSGDTVRQGTRVADCVPETLCVAGAIPSRSEIFFRIIGPRPNGFLWAQGSRFTVSRVEVWIRQLSSGQVNYYDLDYRLEDDEPVDEEALLGFNDRYGFHPEDP